MRIRLGELRREINEALSSEPQWTNRDDPEVAAAIRRHMRGARSGATQPGEALYELLKSRGFGGQSTVTDGDDVFFVRAGRGRGLAYIINRE